MDYQKYVCPVCNEKFKEDDDIVVCPECGTPHHRECWNKVGNCFNQDKHGKEEIKKSDFLAEGEEEKTEIKTEPQRAVVDLKPTDKNPSDIIRELNDKGLLNPSTTFLLDGEESYLYEVAVGKNQKYYMPRFMILSQVKKGITFNFCAFMFPLAWSLYRKMYKLFAIILAIYLAFFGVISYGIMSNEALIEAGIECMEEDPDFYSHIISQGDTILTVKQQKFIEEMNKTTLPPVVSLLFTLGFMAIKMCMGIFANKKYFEKLRKNIKDAKSKGLAGDRLKEFLYKKYGTLPIIVAVLVGFFDLYLI